MCVKRRSKKEKGKNGLTRMRDACGAGTLSKRARWEKVSISGRPGRDSNGRGAELAKRCACLLPCAPVLPVSQRQKGGGARWRLMEGLRMDAEGPGTFGDQGGPKHLYTHRVAG